MNIKSLIAVLFLSLITGNIWAQDKIFQSNGEVIEAKVVRVGANVIVYKSWTDPWAARVTIPKDKVDKIIYQDGCEAVFNNETDSKSTQMPTGLRDMDHEPKQPVMSGKQSILAMSPLQFTETGIGMSFSFEQSLDKSGIVSFILPVVATFNPIKNAVNENNANDYMYYLMPGIKIYPTSNRGKIKYAIGPSMVIGAGERTKYTYYYGYNSGFSSSQEHHNKFIVGVTINNSINFKPTRHIYMGLDFGFGFTYLNRFGDVNQGMGGLVNGGFKIGYIY